MKSEIKELIMEADIKDMLTEKARELDTSIKEHNYVLKCNGKITSMAELVKRLVEDK